MRFFLLFSAWLLHNSWSRPMESWEAAHEMKGAEGLTHLGSTNAVGGSTASSLGHSSHSPSVSDATHNTPPTTVESSETKEPVMGSPLRRTQSEPLQGQDTPNGPDISQAEADKDGSSSMLVPHSHESTPPDPSGSAGSPPIPPPTEPNIFDELKARAKPDKHEWDRDSKFIFPRYPPPEEWRIKTFCIDLWRDHISPKLSKAFNNLFMILLAPFLASPVRDQKFHSIPMAASTKTPKGVWEVLPDEKKFKWPWAKAKDAHWKVPTFPPAFSAPRELEEQQNIEDAYYTGMRLSDDHSKGLKGLEALCDKAELEGIEKEIMLSDDYVTLLKRLYRERNALVLAHEKMQPLLDQLISDWNGEENVRKLFRGLTEHWQKVEATRAGPEAIVKPVSGSGGLFLRKFDPWAHEMHLSPLLLFHIKSDKFLDEVKQSKIVEGYLPDQTTRLDRLIGQGKAVREYADKSKIVQKTHDAVVEYAKRFRELLESEKADPDFTRDTFRNIVRSAYKDE